MSQQLQELEDKIAPIVAASNAVLYACQFTQEDGVASLRVMIDKEGGVDIQTCSDLNRTIGLMLEVDYPKIPEKYQLVVSSPGIERPLLNQSHYEQAVGQDILITLRKAQNNQKRFEGNLESINDHEIVLVNEHGNHQFKLSDIAKSHILWKARGK